MAKGETYWDYVGAIVKLVKGGKSNGSNEVQTLRYNAMIDGVDLYELHRDVYLKINGKQISESQMNKDYKYLEFIYLWKQLVDVKNRHATAPDWEKDNINAEAQALRMKVHAMGLDAYQFSQLAYETFYGSKPTGSALTTDKGLVKSAIQAYDKLNADKRKAYVVPRAKSDTNRPKVKRFTGADHFGETFSGADMQVFMAFPGYKPIEIGTATTVSYTVYRSKKQLRTMGRISPKGIVKGYRTVSGRLIFTVIREHIVESLRREIPYLRNIKTLLMDELPSFDLLVSFGNEYGSAAGMVIQGAQTVDEQKTLSVEDLFTENVFTYIARALEPMRNMFAQNVEEPYEPLDWYTSDFRHPYSEAMAKFKVKDLYVYKETLLLQDPIPFLGGAGPWDSEAAPTLKVQGAQYTGKANKPSGASDQAGNTGSGSGGVAEDGNCKIVVKVYDATSSYQKGVEGATVTWSEGSQTSKTDKSGNAHFFVSNKGTTSAVSGTKSGWTKPPASEKKNPALVTVKGKDIVYANLPLYPPGYGKDADSCTGSDKATIGDVQGYGYWYEHNATNACVRPTKGDGSPNFTPQPSVRVFNKCGGAMEGKTVTWTYKIPGWKNLDTGNIWGNITNEYRIKTPTGKIGTSKTNSNGTATMPDFDFRHFPENANPVIEARTPAPAGQVGNDGDDVVWITFCFSLPPLHTFK
jgi:hypothetical protein